MYLNESHLRVKYLFDLIYLPCTRVSNATHVDLSDVSLNPSIHRSDFCAKFSFPVTSNILAGAYGRELHYLIS